MSITLGAGGNAVAADFSASGAGAPTAVTLSSDYVMAWAPDVPWDKTLDRPHSVFPAITFSSGTTITVCKAEADAIVAAGLSSLA